MDQPLGLFPGVEQDADAQVEHAAHRPHQVDDGVTLGAQGFGGDIGHQGHGGGTVGAHGDEQQPQHNDKAHQLERGGLLEIAVVQHGQQVHQHHRPGGARQDVGGAAAQFCIGTVGQSPEEGQQEQRQDVVRRHNHAGEGLIQPKRALQDQGNKVVVHLPEGADGQKGQAHQDGAFVVQLQFAHSFLSSSLCGPAATGQIPDRPHPARPVYETRSAHTAAGPACFPPRQTA